MAATATPTHTALTTIGQGSATPLEAAARRMYDAEGALHMARQAGIDAWVSAAYDTLHLAIATHAACLQDRVA